MREMESAAHPADCGHNAPAELAAVLPHPPGINATYRSGNGHWYKTAPARQWERDAFLLLRAAGFRALPPGRYWLALSCALYTCRLDVDAPLKIVLDVVAAALVIDDAHVGALAVRKVPVARRADQCLELRVTVRPGADAGAFAALSLAGTGGPVCE